MIKRSWKKKKKNYPGKQDICKICGPPKEWELHTGHDREISLYTLLEIKSRFQSFRQFELWCS